MFSPEALRTINNKKYRSALAWAKKAPRRNSRNVTVFVEKNELTVADGNVTFRPSIDHSILYISKDADDKDFYINHEAGFQRWHKFAGTRREALGYAKQAGVTQEQFIAAFGGKPIREVESENQPAHFPLPEETAVAVIIQKREMEPINN